MGCEPGCGVTHLSIALANYCTSKLQYKTACLELNRPGNFMALSPGLSPLSVPQTNFCNTGFSIYGADYYPAVHPDDIPLLLNADYSYYILDMGDAAQADWNEYLRCDRKLVIGSLAPWKENCYESLFSKYPTSLKNGDGFVYLVQTGNRHDMKDFAKKNGISMERIPFLPNPFQIGREHFTFLEQLLH